MRPSLVLVSDSGVSIEIEYVAPDSPGAQNRILTPPLPSARATIQS